jgi:GNAT superfamily N-acetyltransferase
MDYAIKHITNEHELEKAYAFAKNIFKDITAMQDHEKILAEWHEGFKQNNELLLFAESCGKVVAVVFGFIGNDGNMTVGTVAVDERLRGRGTAREMMLLLEERAKNLGIKTIGLGAVREAEGFYAKLGYTGSLLIQSEKHSIEELLALNTEHHVNYTRVHDGTINQINLALTEANRELQNRYETELPGCYTQMMFWKNI